MLLAHVLGLVWVVEQPSSSCLRDHIRFQSMLRALEALDVKATWAEFQRVSDGLHLLAGFID